QRLTPQEQRCGEVKVLDHPAREGVRRRDEIQALLHVRVAMQGQRFAGRDQEVDDLAQLDIEQGWKIRAWSDNPVEVQGRSRERVTKVPRGVLDLVSFNEFAAHEERRSHAAPRMWASVFRCWPERAVLTLHP